ncbi:MAG: dihydroneopterin aldolase [Bacteroidetes bacterium]|nr:dihydroneopterin aldolase [Bacteroidota bacterium]
MGKITLDGMEFFAYHGCFKEEQLIGTKFIVDLIIETDTSEAEQSDQLHDTVNYVNLYQAVKTEMEQKSHLLEHVARRIITVVTDQFPSIITIELRVSKLNPPVGGKMKQISFNTSWKKI